MEPCNLSDGSERVQYSISITKQEVLFFFINMYYRDIEMSNEDKSPNGFATITRGFIVVVMTMIPVQITGWMFALAVFVDGTVRAYTYLLSIGCFLGGSALIVFYKPSKKNIVVWLSGFALAAGSLLLSWFLFLIVIVLSYPVETLVCLTLIGSVVVYFRSAYFSPKENGISTSQTSELFSFSKLPLSKQLLISGYELKEIPESHLQLATEALEPPRRYKKFLDILRALTLADIPVALRIERTNGKTRVFYLTWAKRESVLAAHVTLLEDSLMGNLSGMRFIACPRFEGIRLRESQEKAVSILYGEPLSIESDGQGEDALTVMAKVLQSMPNGIIQISSTPKRSNSREIRKLEEKYAAEVQRSEQVVSVPRTSLFSGDTQESTTRVDSQAQQKAISLRKQIDRLRQRHLCEVQVNALCWDSNRVRAEENSRRLISTLRGNLAPADYEHALSIETDSKKVAAAQLLRGEPVGKATLLSLSEAIIYFIIPFCDLGIPVVGHATFLSNPQDLRPLASEREEPKRKEVLKLGKIVDDTGHVIADFELPINDLTCHSGAFGDTGTGKTRTQIKVLLELVAHGINFLVLLASKAEDYARMKRKVKGLRIFTVGDSTVAPVRFCLTNFHAGIHVSSIINCIKTAFVASKPADGMVKEYLETLIELTFRRMGWDRETNTRGLPIVIQDFLDTLPLLKKKLQYSLRGNEDFQGAIYGRVCSFFSGALSSVFGTTSGISMDELIEYPSLILVDKLSKDEYSFVAFWLFSNLVLHFEVLKKAERTHDIALKYYVVLEEAHRFLVGEKGMKMGEEHAAQQAAIEVISLAMQEARSSGLGFGIATQKPTQLNSQACEMVMNVFMHRKNAEPDRRLLGSQMGCNEEQIQMMGSLPTGQAVVRTASSGGPVRVLIDNPFASGPESPVTDDEIRTDMAQVFEAHPHFQESPDFAKTEPEIGSLSDAFAAIQLDMPSLIKLYYIISFLHHKGYQSGIENAVKNYSYLPAALIVRNLARAALSSGVSPLFCCLHLLWYFTRTEDTWTDDALKEVSLQLASILPAEQEDVLQDLDVFHERVCAEITERLKSKRIKTKSVEKVIKSAINAAMDEYNEAPLSEAPTEADEPVDAPPPPSLIDTIVKNDDFRDHYISRVRRAAQGELTPLLRFIRLLAKKVCNPDLDESESGLRILSQGRAIYNSPADDLLWERICEAIKSDTEEEGSGSAT
jgi:hypothetical protein